MGIYYDQILIVEGTKKARKNFDKRFYGIPPLYIDDRAPRYCFNALFPIPFEVQMSNYAGSTLPERGSNRLLEKLAARRSYAAWENYYYGCGAPSWIDKDHNNPEDPFQTKYIFSTRNCPATDFVRNIAFKFPTLTFTLAWLSTDINEIGEYSITKFDIHYDNQFDTEDEEGQDLMRIYFPEDDDVDAPIIAETQDNQWDAVHFPEPALPGQAAREALNRVMPPHTTPLQEGVIPDPQTVQFRRYEPLQPTPELTPVLERTVADLAQELQHTVMQGILDPLDPIQRNYAHNDDTADATIQAFNRLRNTIMGGNNE